MSEIMVTSGYGFDGYEITEYLGFVNSQTVIGSNFFKGIAQGVTEMSDAESEKLTSKLEAQNESVVEALVKAAEKRKADAIIGMTLNYTQFSTYSVPMIIRRSKKILKR